MINLDTFSCTNGDIKADSVFSHLFYNWTFSNIVLCKWILNIYLPLLLYTNSPREKNPMNNFYNMEKILWHHCKLDELKGNSCSLTHYNVFPLWLDFKWGIFRLLYGHI